VTRTLGAGRYGRPVLTPTELKAVLAAHGLRPSRALGQNFLVDPNTARRIVRLAGVEPGDRVLEIGPGVGSLTAALVEGGAHVVALEIDRHVLPALEEVMAGRGPGTVQIVHGDAMAVDYDELLGPGPWSLVANLPYNVATPLVADLLDDVPAITRMLVMVQREVGERLAARPGDEAHGAVSIKVEYHAEARVAGLVPPTVFVPRPAVDSALVRIDRRPTPTVDVPDPARLFALVRAGFGQRRKTLRRALTTLLPEPGPVLAAAGIDGTRRAESLALDEWAALARADALVGASPPGASPPDASPPGASGADR
jgi:16S rRNA (adenine1518-N6/adenine1519-N6)-dimethyltransferase